MIFPSSPPKKFWQCSCKNKLGDQKQTKMFFSLVFLVTRQEEFFLFVFFSIDATKLLIKSKGCACGV